MVETLLSGPRMDRALSLLVAWRVFQRVDPKLHWGFRRLQGRIRARLLQNRGRATFGKRLIDISGIGTSARLCDRQKFGKVMVRTGRLSQFCLRFRHRDCNEVGAFERQEGNRQSRSRGRRTPWPEFKKMRLPAGRAVTEKRVPRDAQGAPKMAVRQLAAWRGREHERVARRGRNTRGKPTAGNGPPKTGRSDSGTQFTAAGRRPL